MPCMPHEHPHCHRRHQPASKARSRILTPTPMTGVSDDLLYDHAAVGPDDDRPARERSRASYLLPPGGFVGALPLPWLAKGEAGAASFGFSFLGFLASRLPRFSPLAMAYLRCGSDPGSLGSFIELKREAVLRRATQRRQCPPAQAKTVGASFGKSSCSPCHTDEGAMDR